MFPGYNSAYKELTDMITATVTHPHRTVNSRYFLGHFSANYSQQTP